MAYLAVRKIAYTGDKYSYESPTLSDGLNILEGKNGCGKSTFMNLLYYGLGGTVGEFDGKNNEKHEQIYNDRNNFVQIDIEIDSKSYVLRRNIRNNNIAVFEPDALPKILPIFRSKNEQTIFSDWFLEKLGIEVFDIYQGAYNSKINIKDLMRLIYHDQEPDPRKIYKKPDAESFVSDSEVMRKIVFQILTGKGFSEYYRAISDYKQLDKARSVAKSTLDEFIHIQRQLTGDDKNVNLVHLREVLGERNSQLEKLFTRRRLLKATPQTSDKRLVDLENEKYLLLEADLRSSDIKRKITQLLDELISLEATKERIILEVTQINKIIYTHQTLSLFTPDTCPYCLMHVERTPGNCVCGAKVDELTYEKFFYDSSEYLEILKSKQKSVDTIDLAIEGIHEEVNGLNGDLERLSSSINDSKIKLRNIVAHFNVGVDVESLDEYDDKILSVKDEIQKVERSIQIEERRESLQRELSVLGARVEEAKRLYLKLESDAFNKVLSIVNHFSVKYNEIMRNSLSKCRSARISSENYMPIIDEGLYLEASSAVPIRLNYFLSLLYLSVTDKNVLFPKFLFIDTPDTAGIDDVPLKKTMSQISNAIGHQSLDSLRVPFQIILTTGIGKYPDEYQKYVFGTLTDDHKLLIGTQP